MVKALTQEEFLQKARAIHGDKYDYSRVSYARNRDYIEIICNKCKQVFKQKGYNHLNGKGCNHCRRSLGEAFIQRFLTEHGITYEREKYFKGCKNKGKLFFDFYLPAYNLCIEFQGQQHYEPHFFMALLKKPKEEAIEVLKAQQHRDQIKRDYCKKNGIRLLEITYKDNIEKALIDWFNKL